MATAMSSLPVRGGGAMADAPSMASDDSTDAGTYSCVAVCMDAATGKFMVMSIPAPDEATMADAQTFDDAESAFMAAQDMLKGTPGDGGITDDEAMEDGYAGAKGDPTAMANNMRKYGSMR